MPAPSECTGLILAGGRSRRFGSDKALALLNGRPLVARVYSALAPHCVEVLISTGPTPRAYPVLARPVFDTLLDAGPLAGLAAGLAAARTPWLLAVACDLAYLTPEALAPLLAAAPGDADAIVALDGDGRLQPVCALYHTRIAPTVAAHLAEGRLALYGLLDSLTVTTVALPPDALRNANTPDQLAAGRPL